MWKGGEFCNRKALLGCFRLSQDNALCRLQRPAVHAIAMQVLTRRTLVYFPCRQILNASELEVEVKILLSGAYVATYVMFVVGRAFEVLWVTYFLTGRNFRSNSNANMTTKPGLFCNKLASPLATQRTQMGCARNNAGIEYHSWCICLRWSLITIRC